MEQYKEKKIDYKDDLTNMPTDEDIKELEQSQEKQEKKTLFSIYKELEYKDKYLVVITTGSMCQCFNEDAVLLNRILKYKLIMLRLGEEEYLKTNFPTKRLNSIITKIKEEQRLNIAVLSKQSENFEVKFIKTKKSISKAQFVARDDVDSSILFLNENEECYKDFTIKQVQRGIKSEYQLHVKATDMFNLVSSTLYNYIPKKHKWMHELFVREWADLIKNINLTRNFGGNIRAKCLTHHKISAILDTLKDYTNNIYQVKGYKNTKQYFYIYQTVTEIAKINSGIISRCSSSNQDAA